MDPKRKRTLRLNSAQYQLIDRVLFRKYYNDVFLRCVEKYDADKILVELHDGPTGGHFGGETSTHKILHAGYYWCTRFRDAYSYTKKCKTCQIYSRRERKHAFP